MQQDCQRGITHPMSELSAPSLQQPPPPEWRDEYLSDLLGLERYCEELRAWQRRSDNPFERADAELWSRLTLQQARQVLCHVINLFAGLNASGALGSAYREECEAWQIAGVSPMSETEFRGRLARLYAQRAILEMLPAVEA